MFLTANAIAIPPIPTPARSEITLTPRFSRIKSAINDQITTRAT